MENLIIDATISFASSFKRIFNFEEEGIMSEYFLESAQDPQSKLDEETASKLTKVNDKLSYECQKWFDIIP